MKRKSFGKWAIVSLLTIAMLLSLTVCSKSNKNATDTTKTTVTTTPTAATTPEEPKASTPEPVKTEPVVTEPVVVTPVQEPTVVETPVEKVEEKAEEPVVAPSVEEKVEAKADEPYTLSYDYRGLANVSLEVGKSQATITYPADLIYRSDIDAFMATAASEYPDYASLISYSVPSDGTLVISYPETNENTVLSVLAAAEGPVTGYIDSILKSIFAVASVEEKVEEVESVEAQPYAVSYNYRGLANASIEIGKTQATITYPAELIYRSDIDAFMAAAAKEYPEYAGYITYSVPSDGTLVISYPETDENTVVSLLASAEGEVTGYIDSAIANILTVAPTDVKAEAEVETESVELEPYAVSYNYRGLADASIEIGKTQATITYPASVIYRSDIDAFMAAAAKEYPEYASYITYSIPSDGTLVISYPETDKYTVLSVLASAEGEVTGYIDAALKSVLTVESAIAEAPVEEAVVEDVPLYSTIIATHGISANVVAYADHAVITLPAGTTADDINAVATMLVTAYPEAAYVQYKLDGETLTLTYPEQSESFIASAVTQLKNEAMLLADQVFASAVASVPTETQAVAEAPVEEAKPEVVASEPAPVSPEPVPVAPIAKEADTINRFSASLAGTFGINTNLEKNIYGGVEARFGYAFNDVFSAGIITGWDGDNYIPLKAFVRANIPFGGLYGFVNGGVKFGINKPIKAVLGLGLGYEFEITDNFSVFAEAAVDFSFLEEKKVGGSFTIGGKYSF